jgi:hypothetical protein
MTRSQLLSLGALLSLLVLLGSGFPASLASAQEQGPAASPSGQADAGAVQAALGPAFTYQGNLARNGQPVNATCAFRFSLWDELAGGAIKADPYNYNAVPVKAGVFTVLLNFLNRFTGDERYLQTEVKCPGDADFVTLAPRQLLNAVPYAIGLRPGAVMQSSASGDGLYVEKTAPDSVAIHGKATLKGGTGVLGVSNLWAGVWGQSDGASGVVGISKANANGGVYGENTSQGYGVHGKALNNAGVFGESRDRPGMVGTSSSHDGVHGTAIAPDRIGVKGVANAKGAVGVWGESAANTGVFGITNSGVGVWGASTTGTGVYGASGATGPGLRAGVRGENSNATGTGVLGRGYIGVEGRTDGTAYSQGVLGDNDGSNTRGFAGYFNGRVQVAGNLIKGGGSFQIDHPLDPENKYLSHSFVESPDMKNIYDGVVVLDANGKAVVQLPAWFEALNRDFRYQLTGIGGYAPVYISQEVAGNQFQIAGGTPGLKVSWQVTGIRHDPYAEQNRVKVEEEKPAFERGRYLYPAAYGLPTSAGIAAMRGAQVPAAPSSTFEGAKP